MNRWLLLAVSMLALGCGSSTDTVPDLVGTEVASDTAGEDAVPDVLEADVPGEEVRGVDAEGDVPPPVDPGIRLREAGWLRGDLHMHTQHSDGDDTTATVIGLAEYLQDETFLAAHPEFEGNHLDFISITDHRTVATLDDPEWTSDKLILIPGEEYGGPSHANAWGISEHVPHDPGGDGATLEDYLAGVDAVHGQGGLFSMNHPFDTGTPFPFDVRTHDGVEVWNTAWALMAASYTPELLEAWEASHGPASPFFRKAVTYQGITGASMALRFYEAQLSLGIHVAVVGGSDRHLLLLNGFPTTWVRADSADVAGFLDGVSKRHTFVSRRPTGVTLEVAVEVDGQLFEMGDAIPLAQGGAFATVRVRVGRADGALLRLMRGHTVVSDEALADAALGAPVLELPVEGADFEAEMTLTVEPGEWFYPVVLEPLVAPGLPDALAALVPEMALAALATGSEDYDSLIELFWDILDFSVVLAPQDCDPANWDPTKMQCSPVDVTGIATYYVPDWVDRALNAVMEEGEPSAWCMGAVGSAVRFVAP